MSTSQCWDYSMYHRKSALGSTSPFLFFSPHSSMFLSPWNLQWLPITCSDMVAIQETTVYLFPVLCLSPCPNVPSTLSLHPTLSPLDSFFSLYSNPFSSPALSSIPHATTPCYIPGMLIAHCLTHVCSSILAQVKENIVESVLSFHHKF